MGFVEYSLVKGQKNTAVVIVMIVINLITCNKKGRLHDYVLDIEIHSVFNIFSTSLKKTNNTKTLTRHQELEGEANE